MAGGIVGRDSELASLRAFVESISDGAAGLALAGEAGVGKTTLWTAGIELAEAGGASTLLARPAESEAALSFAGLRDLLDPVLDEVVESLPAAQKRALARALVLEDDDGPPPDSHAVGVAVLNAFRFLASSRSLVVAVDDLQWLDTASAEALTYAARRLRAERIGLLLSHRDQPDAPLLAELRRSLPADRLRELEVGPIDLAALHVVVQDHLGVALPRPLLREVHRASGGNPFYALEIVRMLRRAGTVVEAGQPLPLPESLHDLVRGRLHALPPESRDFLAAAASHAQPTVTVTEAATGVDRELGLRPALDARVVELQRERIRFTHPLLAAGAYETADPQRRREIHGRLAELLEDPEARAWQLCASVDRPDEEVAAVLEDAARHARARGAPRPAALLLDRATELTPGDRGDDEFRRAIDAAFLHFESGDSRRAEMQLQAVVDALEPGLERARALVRLARVRSYEAQDQAARLFLQAIEEARGDVETLAIAHEGVAACFFRLRERLPEAVQHATTATELALDLGDEALVAESTGTRLISESLLGLETARETAKRALALQDAAASRRVLGQPLFAVAVHLWWTDMFEPARDAMLQMLQRADELGDESSVPYVLVLLGRLECALCELDAAHRRALAGQEAAAQAGQETLLAYHIALEADVEARRGNSARADALASDALARVPTTGGRPAELVAREALGHLELALGNAGAAHDWLVPGVAFARREATVEPAAFRLVVDHIEALIELGRRDEAIELLEWYEGNATRLDRISALASCARCRGLLAAQAGELDAAQACFREALELHDRVELPLDRGRTLLVLGASQRRAKRRREARATLEEALRLFERIGTAIWANRARNELRRISGRAPAAGALTPAEERVAALVCEGKTNREVAAALFLSDRTVEGHLSHIFGKLGISHRSELARALAGLQTQGEATPNTGDSPVSAGPVAP